MKPIFLFIIPFLFCTITSYGQSDYVYTDLKKALKNPEKVFQLNLRWQQPKEKDLKRIASLYNLQQLDLSCTELDYFPESILDCKKLTYLNLSNNTIPSIPSEIDQLTDLKELNIGWNEIESLPASIGKLTKLKRFDFSGNIRFKHLPTELAQLQSLEYLCCTSTAKEFDDIICKLLGLEELRIYSSESILICSLVSFKKLKKFNLTLSLRGKLELFDCSLVELSELQEFTVLNYNSCQPYSKLPEDQMIQIQSLLPNGCQLKVFGDSREELKSDIYLR